MENNTYCRGYDDQCFGCVNEKRWHQLMCLPVKERSVVLKNMHLLDEGDCQAGGMLYKVVEEKRHQ